MGESIDFSCDGMRIRWSWDRFFMGIQPTILGFNQQWSWKYHGMSGEDFIGVLGCCRLRDAPAAWLTSDSKLQG